MLEVWYFPRNGERACVLLVLAEALAAEKENRSELTFDTVTLKG